MTIQQRIELGQVDYHGKIYTAIREVYENSTWRLVLVHEEERIVIMVH